MTNNIEVSNWMKSKHIVVPNDWLEACLNWVVEEHKHEDLSLNKIKTYVYEQWLIADLREIGSSCLPDVVFTNQKSTLHGIYALQMIDIRDISQPSYNQLLKLRGNNNQNSIVSAEPQQPLQPWEVKPKRMMMMTLTDGTQSLQAMEYIPIPALHFGLPPGTKLQICGPVDCRLGILLLTAEKIQILGGEVESLVAENSSERILLRVLGQDDSALEGRSNQHHTEDSQSFDSGINISENTHVHHGRTSLTSCRNNAERSLRSSNLLPRTASHSSAVSNVRKNSIDLTVSDDVEEFPDSTNDIVAPDEFEDDDEFLNNLDYDHIDQLVQECSGTSSERNKSGTAADSSSCKIRTPPPMLLDIPDWDLDDFI